MVTSITKEDILNILDQVEHPEIAASLVELGMILDAELDDSSRTVNIAVGLPAETIPQAVEKALVENISEVLNELHLKAKVHFFDMPENQRRKFFEIARARWKQG